METTQHKANDKQQRKKTYLELHIVVLELRANQHGGLNVGTLGDLFGAAGFILKAAPGLPNGVVVVGGFEITEQGNVGIELRAFVIARRSEQLE